MKKRKPRPGEPGGRPLTEHEKQITLYGEYRDGVQYYWAGCSEHGSIIGVTTDINERGYAVKFHLRGLM